MSPERATSLFGRLARGLLPRALWREFADELLQAFRDRYARTRRVGGWLAWARFWRSEIAGLLRTALPSFATLPSLESFDMRHDLLYALRMIVRTPVVSGIAVISLALALAANTTIFATLNAWLLRPLPYPEAERMVLLYQTDRSIADETLSVSPANFIDAREQVAAFEQLYAIDFNSATLTGVEEPETLSAGRAHPAMLRLLGVRPLVGRLFEDDEAAPGRDGAVILRESLWRIRFGADPAVVGRTVRVDGREHQVIGVLPDEFEFVLGGVQAWLPSDFRDRRDEREQRGLLVVGKLASGVTMEQAQEQVSALAERLSAQYPDTNRNTGLQVQTLRQEFPGPTDTMLIQALMMLVLAALAVACFNVAGLYLAKAEVRGKEIAVRLALGARRGRVLRLLLTESVMLALIAAALALGASVWAMRALGNALPPQVPRMNVPHMDATVLVFTLLCALGAGTVFGISPALQALRADRRRSALLDGSRGGTAGRSRKRARGVLVALEFALALAVLVSAGSLTASFAGWLEADPGFDADSLLLADVTLPDYRYVDDASRRAFIADFERELGGIAGAQAAGLTTHPPRGRNWRTAPVRVEGVELPDDELPWIGYSAVTPGFFAALELDAIEGRAIEAGDREDVFDVAVVNRRFVERILEGRGALGQRVHFRDRDVQIVGVIDDIAQTREHGLRPAEPWIYLPLAQQPGAELFALVRAEGDPLALVGGVRAAVRAVDPEQPVASMQALQTFIDGMLAGPTFITGLMFMLGALALALAVMGIYGVVAFSVTQQTREIGIRMALGARAGQVLAGVLRHGATLAGLGLLLGTPLAIGLMRMFSAALGSLDATLAIAPMLGTVALLAAAAALACYLPARRAARIDPAVALQEE